MIVPFFPAPYKDELLYSVLARCGSLLSACGPKALMRKFYGNASAIATVDLPNRVNDLAVCLDLPNVDGTSLVETHTLYRYYTAFQTQQRRDKALLAMLGDAGSVQFTLGISTFRTLRPTHLQFCPLCMKDALQDYGFFYWHRAHQLPGVLVCAAHGCRLRRSLVRISAVNRHEYIAASLSNCPSNAAGITSPLRGSIIDQATDFSRRSAAILECATPAVSPQEIRDGYRERLRSIGLVKGKHKVRQTWLAEAMTQTLGTLLDRMTGVDLNAACETWLASLTRTSAGAHPPAQHILLRMLLDEWETCSDDWRATKLEAIAEAASPHPTTSFSLEWDVIDRDYSIKMRRRAQILRRRSPPVRVSLAAVERPLGGRDWLAKRRDRMPISVRAARDIIESVSAFRHRRMRWHLDRCACEGVTDPWTVVRRAGLPGSFIDTVKAALPLHVGLARVPRAVFRDPD